ncbi:YqaJ viral recombinase family protein [Streptosporangium sp. OZ121]|uniref:YqaJ viral recombinase family nuclease n=1 Tax=Streptosporangium sp. OZ121 TaxID=3444183 RepID=UPI003F78C90F
MTTLVTPTGRFLGQWPSNTPEWYAARAHRIGGSDVAAIVRLSKWQSRYALWCEKTGLVEPDPPNSQQSRGHFLEPGVANWFAYQHPDVEVVEAGTWTHVDPERDWQLANPDRLLVRDGQVVAGLEIKTDVDGRDWGKPGTDEIPLYYLTQVRWYMDVLGLDEWWVAVLGSHLEFSEYIIRPDIDDTLYLRDAAEEFLRSIAWDEMPTIDGHDATYRTVRKLHPLINSGEKFALPDDLAAEVLPALAEEKSAKEAAQKARAKLLAAMGNASHAYWDEEPVARRQAKGEGTPYLVVEKNLPAIPELLGAAA